MRMIFTIVAFVPADTARDVVNRLALYTVLCIISRVYTRVSYRHRRRKFRNITRREYEKK